MLALRRGETSAFEQLFTRWSAPLLRFLERMVQDTAIAEELVQDTFLRVWKARERYSPDARFSTWLYRIGTNVALNELRRPRRRHPHATLDAPIAGGSDEDAGPRLEVQGPGIPADELASQRVELARTRAALEQLPDRQRAALWLSAVEGLSYAEVATALETTEKSVKALVHRGRTSLATALGGADRVSGARSREEVGR